MPQNILPEEDESEENFDDIEESKNSPRNPLTQDPDILEYHILAQVFLFQQQVQMKGKDVPLLNSKAEKIDIKKFKHVGQKNSQPASRVRNFPTE